LSTTGSVKVRETPLHEGKPDAGQVLECDRPTAPVSGLGYMRLFWANRRFLLRAGAYSLVASLLIALLIPVRYQTTTRLMPPDNNPSGLGMLAALAGRGSVGSGANTALGGIAGDLLGMKSSGSLFVGMLGSETVQDRLIDQFQLQRVYRDSKIEDARKDLVAHTTVSEDRKSGIISIGVTDHDPKRAAEMARAYVNELDRSVARLSTSSARREREFLEERLKAVKSDLDTASRNFSDFASKNTAIDIPAQGRAMVEAAAVLQGQMIAAQAELSGLQQIYTASNVRVRAAEARVNELQKKLNEVGGAGTQAEVKDDKSLYPSIRKIPLLGVTYADLFRQTKIQETVYELLTEQYELAKVQEAKEIPTVKVLDPALVPTKRSFPPIAVITILGTLLGISLAMTWLLGKTRWNSVEMTDPRKEFAVEVFTTMQRRLPRFSRNGFGSNGHHREGIGRSTGEPDTGPDPDRPEAK
jgi:uncharacterized protein involved in exopolysaccharide biosynthesis